MATLPSIGIMASLVLLILILIIPSKSFSAIVVMSTRSNDQCSSSHQVKTISDLSLSSFTGNTAAASCQESTDRGVAGTNAHQRKWLQRFEQLVDYAIQHGHCNPSPHKDYCLAMWTKNQRTCYRYDQKGIRPMSQERKDLLNSIGFLWSVQDAKWMQMYAELVRFHSAHGHSNVPIAMVQQQHRNSNNSSMNNNNNNNNNNISQQRETVPWNPSQHHHVHDERQRHAHPPPPPLPMWSDKLASWVAHQRYRYKRTVVDTEYYHAATSSSSSSSNALPLTRHQMELLDDISFASHPRDETWWKRFHELEDFLATHGHCHVPQKYGANPKLGTWCHHQRRACKEYALSCMIEQRVQGVHVSGLNEERLRALRSIDFCWFPEEPFVRIPEGVLDSWYVTSLR